ASMAGVNLFFGSAAASLVLVVAVAFLGSARRLDASTATGVALAGAFAVGVLLQSSRPGASKDLTAFLVGSVLTVGRGDLVLVGVVLVIVAGALTIVHKELVLGAFDRDGAEAMGYRPLVLDLLVLVIVAVTVATSVPAVGTILVVALLVTPALAARLWVERVGAMMVVAAAIGSLSGVAGLAASEQWRVAAGASIALAATTMLAVSAMVLAVWRAFVPLSRRSVAAPSAATGADADEVQPVELGAEPRLGRHLVDGLGHGALEP
ncbi:MAG: metal ABC transporter permease, partial [Actinobacteria bacterium]|nr:metal ABC transporter permease [Actinomycetota bacterium]